MLRDVPALSCTPKSNSCTNAVGDRDGVEPVVEDARAEAGAVDGVAVEVDGDAVGADDQAVAGAVEQVVGDAGCSGVMTWPQLTFVATGAAPTVQVNSAGRRVGVALGVDGLHLEGVGADAESGVALRRGAGREGRAVERALEGDARLVGARR